MFNTSYTMIAAGIGMAASGAYKYNTANSQQSGGGKTAAVEAANQKKYGLYLLAAGVASVAAGVGLLYFNATDGLHEEQSLGHVVEEPVKTHVNVVLRDPLQRAADKEASNSSIGQIYRTINETVGLDWSNYLPWKGEYFRGGTGHIDGIDPDDMSKPVMWGFDGLGDVKSQRPFVAVKYLCDVSHVADRAEEISVVGSGAIFQRYSDGYGADYAALGSHFYGNGGCFFKGVASMLGNTTDFKSFLQGKTVTHIDEALGTVFEITQA